MFTMPILTPRSLAYLMTRARAALPALFLATILAVFAIATAACGDGNGDGGPTAEPDPVADPEPGADPEQQLEVDPNAPVVDVDLTEWALVADTASIEAGVVTFNAINAGTEVHELVILKTDDAAGSLPTTDGLVDESAYAEIGEIEEFAPGLERAASFRLEPGNYVLLCNIAEVENGELESHYENGMYAAFEVEQISGDLIVYSGREEELLGPLIGIFEEATGIDVSVRYGSNSGLVATIFEEGGNSPADIFFGSDPGALGAIGDRLTVLPDDILDQVDSPFRSGAGRWVGVSGRARVVVYNTDVLTEADLPDSIYGFTDPAWAGRIGWAPTNGSFQAMVTAMRLIDGEDAARDWLEGIRANGATEYPKNTPIVQAAAEGEIDVGFVNHYYLFRFLAEEGESFAARNYYLPGGDSGAVVLVAGAGILDSASHVPAAELFLNFLLSQEAQQYFTDETFEYPLIEGVETNPLLAPLASIEVPDLDLSGLSDLEGTVALLRETGVIP